MKVAIVYPYFAHYRGSIIELLSSDKNFDYFFIGGTKKNSSSSSIKLYDFSDDRRFLKVENIWILKYFLWQRGLAKHIKSGKYNAVILFADWKYISTWFIIPYLYKNNIPFLFWSHGLLNNKPSINNNLKMLFFKLFVHGGFVYDNRAKQIMQSKGYTRTLNVIYNSLNSYPKDSVAEATEPGSVGDKVVVERPYVIFSGRLIQSRKLEVLFDAIKLLANKGVAVDALIIGNGPCSDTLKSYVKDRGIQEQITFYGSCYDEIQLSKFFMNAIACVFPGPVGLTAIHSLTYGTPVITNDNLYSQKPEVEAVVEGQTGAFFEDGSPVSLAEKIEYFCGLSLEERKVYKENCFREIRQKFNATNQHKIINQTLAEILN